MMKDWKTQWNERYSQQAYAYGVNPNEYFKQILQSLPVGNLLLPAEGEGRNAVYASKLGWKVSAFDISEQAKVKAMQLAKIHEVEFDYQIGELESFNYAANQFDVIALIYAHLPAEIKSSTYRQFDQLIKKDGFVIAEVFSKNHLTYVAENPSVGGPRNAEMLFSTDEFMHYFKGYKVIELVEQEIELHEGMFHQGKGSVIRFVAQKI